MGDDEDIKAYRVKVSVRNNKLLSAIEKQGYKSVAEFARWLNVSNTNIHNMVAMRVAPLTRTGEFSALAKNIMEVLGAAPTDLWTTEQLNMCLPRSSAERAVDASDIQAVLSGSLESMVLPSPETSAFEKERADILDMVMAVALTPREREVMLNRFYKGLTLEECAASYGATRERIRQMEAKALRKLRHARYTNALQRAEIID